ncbi:MAG TPA: radical SAM protein [Candidatus Baltobacteraceae bacterium]|jgi:wyosine [tRNA(Phe)-imidazoG37] synthetase (radical SAM superfamily)|nr:radical SAM protein [Candidatus Baltobacteraceae bacterium]
MSAKLCVVEEVKESCAPLIETAFGCPRDFLGNRFVYVVISPRARGLSIGLNMNPDKFCNFDCVYCEVNRDVPPDERELDVSVMATELEKTLLLIRSGGIRQLAGHGGLSPELLRLRHVAFSGDGEPTLCVNFAEAVQSVVHVRARGLPFFKIVLITNGTCLDLSPVQEGLRYFTRDDEIWIKLDAGTQAYMDWVNRSEVSLDKVMKNATLIGRKRPIIIQSLFPLIAGQEPPPEEIDQYIQRLRELKDGGAMISLVQIYSATRPTTHSECGHIPLQSLAAICHRIKVETGLKSEVF